MTVHLVRGRPPAGPPTPITPYASPNTDIAPCKALGMGSALLEEELHEAM